ncbi:MAG: helix-turn-helix transcriptional regulator [Clostridiales bacterium]|nr:helix-turn-helix transcriptional regulator [Clostridiales bacterium]
MDIYQRIDKLLREKDMTRKQLAALAGINYSTIATIFSRKPKHFPHKYAEKIASVLQVSVDELYESDNELQRIIESLSSSEILEVFRHKLLENFNSLNFTGKMTLLQISSEMATMPQYKDNEDDTIVWKITRSTEDEGNGAQE